MEILKPGKIDEGQINIGTCKRCGTKVKFYECEAEGFEDVPVCSFGVRYLPYVKCPLKEGNLRCMGKIFDDENSKFKGDGV